MNRVAPPGPLVSRYFLWKKPYNVRKFCRFLAENYFFWEGSEEGNFRNTLAP